MVGEFRYGVTGFTTIYATDLHRLLVQVHDENLRLKNNYSNLASEQDIIYLLSTSMNIMVTGFK